jgi:hypothetical protein
MNHIERVVVDECVDQESSLVGQLRQRLGERPVKFVFLATEYPRIPDIEILDKLLDARSALLTQDRVLHNLASRAGDVRCMTALPPKADVHPRSRYVAFVPNPDIGRALFDHLIGASEQRRRRVKAERRSSLARCSGRLPFNLPCWSQEPAR